ncbi:MAG TPA: NADP-dependent oxidoreductase [Candidatus Dormibacteraeota bacterium]|nr:NADP-dependent oxidoreductase [Candidatus Dormibacteraeota bacterium]
MRAFAIDDYGAPGSLHVLPTPEVGAGQLLVRIHAAGVNPADWKLRDGLFGTRGRPFPLVLGQDFAGVVERIGAQVSGYAVGDRVFGVAPHGSYAEYAAVDASGPMARIPASLDDARAAALPTAGLTALASIAFVDPKPDETLLVVGATGGVGGYATQIAHARGVRVVATARSGKERVARSFGADEVIAYDLCDVVAEVTKAHPKGVEALIDVVSDDAALKRISEVLRRPGGRLATTVFAADETWFAQHGLRAANIAAQKTPQWSPEGLAELARMVESGALSVRIDAEMALADAGRALERSKTGQISGKIVLRA